MKQTTSAYSEVSNGSSLGGLVSVRFQNYLEASLTSTWGGFGLKSSSCPVGSAHSVESSYKSSNEHVLCI